jgi:peptidyl-prolyl isomerase H (cyclophilin H)
MAPFLFSHIFFFFDVHTKQNKKRKTKSGGKGGRDHAGALFARTLIMAPKKAAGKGAASGSVAAGGDAQLGQPVARPLYTMSILKGSDPYGTLIFELATDVLPRTTENFKQLAQGVTVGDKKNPKTASYKGCRFLRLTAEGLQTGDALHKDDGKGNDSVYGPTFDDETLRVYPHTFGTLSMCNSGPNTNGSQFFICCLPPSRAMSSNATTNAVEGGSTTGDTSENPTPAAAATSTSPATNGCTTEGTSAYLDSRHVAFGKLMDGSDDVLHRLLDELRPFANTNEEDDGPMAGFIDPQAPFTVGAIAPL